MLCEGSSLRAAGRVLHSHHRTVMRLGRAVGEGYARLHDELFVGLHSNFIEVDEAWGFVHKKQARVVDGDPREYGDQYSYVAMEADKKAILSYLVGKRNEETTVSFALDLRGRLLGSTQITSDGWHPYIKALAIAFGRSVDYAQLIKYYGADCTVETSRRYSPNTVKSTEKILIFGDPDLDRISTSFIERQNLTLRMLTRRWTRLTNAFSKKIEFHTAAMDLYVGYYNLCRVHETLGKTPAMAMKVTKHVWKVEELIEECLKRYDPKKPPMRSGSQRYAEIICDFGRCREAKSGGGSKQNPAATAA